METAKRVLVVANRSVATPELLDEIRRRSGDCDFTLLIPDAPGAARGSGRSSTRCR